MRSTFLQVGVTAASATKAIRSSRVTRGLATERCSTASWCRSKAISASNDQRGRKTSATAAARTSTAWSMAGEGSAVLREFPADPRSSHDDPFTGAHVMSAV
jgi:hypothetical protein